LAARVYKTSCVWTVYIACVVTIVTDIGAVCAVNMALCVCTATAGAVSMAVSVANVGSVIIGSVNGVGPAVVGSVNAVSGVGSAGGCASCPVGRSGSA
jgi:hypothetical protein